MKDDAAREALRQGDLAKCREELFKIVRSKPEDKEARIFLTQFLMIIGDWDRAKKQLEVYTKMDPESLGFAAIYSTAMATEDTRAAVFRGEASPPIFGEPKDWLANLTEAVKLDGKGDAAGAQAMREQAYATADGPSGTIDGKPFEWLTDADARFGPSIEAVINGEYHWLPFSVLSKLTLEEPKDLRDHVWMEGAMHLTNGGEFGVLIPTRYPGVDEDDNPAHKLARATDWEDIGGGMYKGAGQRMLATDQEDIALMDVREITFNTEVDHGDDPLGLADDGE